MQASDFQAAIKPGDELSKGPFQRRADRFQQQKFRCASSVLALDRWRSAL